MNENVSKFIQKLRKKYNLTQQDLANILGVTYQAVSKWENKKSIPDIEILQQICKKYNVNIKEILEGKKERNLKWFYIAIPITIIMITAFFWINHTQSFEFKTIISDSNTCSIDGVIAYSKNKSSIYISNISMLDESKEEYQVVECTLYEKNKKISSCENKSDEVTTLSNLLQDVSFYIKDSALDCSQDLYLAIKATDQNQKEINYHIPLKLVDYCK